MRDLKSSVIESFVSIDIEASETTDASKTGNHWTVEDYTEKSMFIQMVFDNPIFLSAGVDVDQVLMKFQSEQIFFD